MGHVTFTAPADQLETLAVTAGAAQVRVIAGEETTEATLEISGPKVALRDVEVDLTAGTWSVFVPEQTTVIGGGTVTNIQSNSGMVIGGGTVVINGVVFTNNGTGTTVVQQNAVEPVTVTAHIPRGTPLRTNTSSGNTRVTGFVHEVISQSHSGNLYVADAGAVRASSTSGDITVSHADTIVIANSTSGDIDVRGGTDIHLRTTSGDIGFASTRICRLTASATSGDITLVRNHQVQANVSTTSGDIHG